MGTPVAATNDSGTFYVPETFPSPVIIQRYVDFGRDYVPEQMPIDVQKPVWGQIVVRGNSTEYQSQITAFGTVDCTVRARNVGSRYGPAYVDAACNGVFYQIQTGIVVTIPRNVFDQINQSATYVATAQ